MCAALSYLAINIVEEDWLMIMEKCSTKWGTCLISRLLCQAKDGEPECSHRGVEYKQASAEDQQCSQVLEFQTNELRKKTTA